MRNMIRVKTGYRVEFSGRYEKSSEFVDSLDRDDVYYLFHCFINDPDVRIYVVYHDGSEFEVFCREVR